jgi:hypothetical protein
MSEGADLIELKLDILGDPDYIPTGDGFFQKEELANRLYTEPYWPDGTINYDLTIPHVQVNFKTPTEYNDLTGLSDPTVDKKYSSSAFSGIYKVIEVDSTFQGGSFTQKLNLVRTKTQPDENGQIEQNSYAESFDPGTTQKSAKKEVSKQIAKKEQTELEKQQETARNFAVSGTAEELTPAQPGPSLSQTTAAGNARFGDPLARARARLAEQQLTDTNTEIDPAQFDAL